jgi:predicted O-linked N-acetylglucosamine transferase (SPINDLY family)
LGITLQELGRLEDAEASCKKAIELKPNYAEAHYNLGITLHQLGRLEDAEASYEKAIAIKPDFAEAHNNLGITLQELGRLEDAEASYEKAIAIKPDVAEAHYNLGNTLKKLGRLEDAKTSYNKAIALKPNYVDAHYNLGITLQELGRLEDAEASYEKAIALKPDYVDAHLNLGNTLRELGRLEDAEASFSKAIALKPDYAIAHNNLGNILKQLGRLEDAETSYKKAIELNPKLPLAHSNFGLLLGDRGLWEESVKSHQTSVTLDPSSVDYRWNLTVSQIPKVVENECDTSKFLSQFNTELTKLSVFIDLKRMDEASKSVGLIQPYYIAYFKNNNKNLLMKYGEICSNVMRFWQEKRLNLPLQSKLNNTKKIKLGIISSHIRYHSIWNAFLKGIITQIDKEQFDLYIYYLEGCHDEETNTAKNNVYRFISGPKSLEAWYDIINNDNLDVVFFPEIGMNQKTLQLASMRIAKSQLTSWGHPETSGLPTIDYYLSASILEDSNSANNYSEKLVCLDNMGCYFDPPSLEKEDIDLSTFGINLSSNILLCLGVPNKFHPDNDWIFIEISKRIADHQLIFMQDRESSYKVLEKRLRLKFKNNGLKSEGKIIFIPNLTRNGFNTLMNAGKILLDNMYFSSFNTSMQALGCNLPVVTMQGNFMRSKATSGMLKMIKVEELIATNEKIYIQIIEKLINDDEYYKFLKDKIKKNIDLLYRDTAPIRSLEKFLINLK